MFYVIGTYLDRPGNAIPLPDRPPPRNKAEARQQDLEDLGFLLDYDRSFSATEADAFRTGVAKLRDTAGAMTDAAFELAVSRLVALSGNGHTTVDKKQRAGTFPRAPLRFAWFADGLYVVRARGAAEQLIGRRVMEVDGRPVEQALTELTPYLSGTIERARIDSVLLLDCPALLRVIWPDTDGLHLTVGLDDGTAAQLEILPPAAEPFELQPIMTIA